MNCVAKQTKRWHCLWALGIAGLIGCSSGLMPSGPTMDAPDAPLSAIPQAPTASMRLAISPLALSKPAGQRSSSPVVRKKIDATGGKLAIAHKTTLAEFSVPAGALKESTVISMQIEGQGPAAIVEFGPSGLDFLNPATLTISFPAKGVDVESLGGYLLEEDGSATPVPYKIIVRGNRIWVIIQIDHFSQYGTDDGEIVGEILEDDSTNPPNP